MIPNLVQEKATNSWPGSQSSLHSVYVTARRVRRPGQEVVFCGIPYMESVPLTDDRKREYTYVPRQKPTVSVSILTEMTMVSPGFQAK